MILTYGRSGSTLTHDIINTHPDVFSFFEPLHNYAFLFSLLQEDYSKAFGKHVHLTGIEEYNILAVSILQKMFTCDYHDLSRLTSLNHHVRHFKSTREMYYCVQRAATLEQEEKCLRAMQKRCEQKRVRLVKTIRLSVKMAESLFQSNPCLKMIYLVRDPRGSYHSKSKFFQGIGVNTTYDAERFCPRFDKDIDAVIELKARYPDRVYMVRFENMVEDTIDSSRKIYNFIGLDFSPAIEKTVYDKIHAKGTPNEYTVNRANATEACFKWRTTIDYSVAQVFDKYCSQPYSKLGYLPAKSLVELRDLSKPLLSPSKLFGN
ncbi:hypothetical protein EGW08_004175 [Elysia chlorotica]|uniref:Sulfotransferase domain-containing protein n=1 Tax=Elysia chlorotica TaxID=188477 RepID=A0A3S1BSX3_ELYCH|nr:hypothetical protein EGW08_004175 [Elysia chlorotica]